MDIIYTHRGNHVALTKSEIKNTIETYGSNNSDSGSTAVQIALFTKDIQSLIEHLKANPKDIHSQRGLIRKVRNREKFLDYLFRKDKAAYLELIKSLNIRDKRKAS